MLSCAFPPSCLLPRPLWTMSKSSRTSPGTTAWPICWKPLSGCCAPIPSSSNEVLGGVCSSCLHRDCVLLATGVWSWTREAVPCSCPKEPCRGWGCHCPRRLQGGLVAQGAGAVLHSSVLAPSSVFVSINKWIVEDRQSFGKGRKQGLLPTRDD